MKPSSKAVMIGCISFFVFLYGNLLFGGLDFLHILDSQKNQSAFRQNGRKINLCFENRKLSNSVRCFALWHFYTLLNHTCNICNGIGAVILEPF